MSEPVRIAYIIGSLAVGGAEQQLVNLVNALPENVEPVLFVLRDHMALVPRITHPRARIELIGIRARWDVPRWLRLGRELSRLRPAVVHSHMTLSNFAARALSGKARVINHEHGLAVGKGWVFRAVDGGSQRLADRIVVVSQASRDLRIKNMRLDPARVTVLPNAIDYPLYRSVKPAPSDRPASVWGIASRLHWVKRIELAIDLVAIAKRRGLEHRLLIAGDGDERTKLEHHAKAKDVLDRVEFLGEVTDMAGFYAKIDVLLLMSSSEDCPVSVIEALAAGKFVAATAVGGIPELLEGRNGLSISDVSNLDAVVDRLASIPPGYDSPENRAAAARFDLAEYVKELLRLYEIAP